MWRDRGARRARGGASSLPVALAAGHRLVEARLARDAALIDLAAHRRSLALLDSMHRRLLVGPLDSAGIDEVLDALSDLLELDAAALVMPAAGAAPGFRVICRLAPGVPRELATGVRELIARALVASGAEGRAGEPRMELDVQRAKRARRASSRRSAGKPRRAAKRARSAPASSLIVPLGGTPDGGDVAGFLGLFARRPGAFSPTDLRHLGPLLPGLMTALASGHSLSALRRSRRERDAELGLASDIQRHLDRDSGESVSGLAVARASRPALGIGGDMVEMLPLADGRVALVVADASGKGLPGALAAALVRGALHGLRGRRTGAAGILAALEEVLAGDLVAGSFVTAAVTVMDRARRELEVAHAGHEPVLVLPAEADEPLDLAASSLPLGTGGLHPRRARRIAIGPGDLVVLYTDGLTDAADANGRRFGRDRLRALVAGCRGLAPHAIVDRLLSAVARFRGPYPAGDDVSLLVARVASDASHVSRPMTSTIRALEL
jgi:serine phosphatase RsbU (regulator of sigma subunit)